MRVTTIFNLQSKLRIMNQTKVIWSIFSNQLAQVKNYLRPSDDPVGAASSNQLDRRIVEQNHAKYQTQ